MMGVGGSKHCVVRVQMRVGGSKHSVLRVQMGVGGSKHCVLRVQMGLEPGNLGDNVREGCGGSSCPILLT